MSSATAERARSDGEVILDVGCGEDPDDRATHTADIRDVADEQFDATTDRWTFPDGHADGVILNHVVEHWTKEQIAHAFSEAGRVLGADGWLELTVPLGANFRSDGDHEPPVWTWERPEMWSRDHRRGWDPDVPFTLTERSVRLWAVRPFGFLTPAFRSVQHVLGDGLWSTELANAPLMSGELTARYEYRDAVQEKGVAVTDGGMSVSSPAPISEDVHPEIVPECLRCDEPGVPGEHKGEDVVKCPDCGHILFRVIGR